MVRGRLKTRVGGSIPSVRTNFSTSQTGFRWASDSRRQRLRSRFYHAFEAALTSLKCGAYPDRAQYGNRLAPSLIRL